MIELKQQYPFVDDEGTVREDLIKHYAEDENGKKYLILQKETGVKYGEAVDVYPCRYTYEVTNEEIIEQPEEEVKEDIIEE